MSNYGPRLPLHFQSAEIAKAAKENPSWESFRPSIVHPMGQYGDSMYETHTGVNDQWRVRRYPNGQLDVRWTVDQIIDAIHSMEFNGTVGDPNTGSASLLPIQAALLTVVFPEKFQKIEPMQAEILTQLSDSEKEQVKAMVVAHFLAEEGWGAGQAGGMTSGRMRRNVGG